VSGSGISWAICKSAPHDRQITKPAPHRSNFLQAGCPSYRPTMSKHWRQNPNETPKPIHTKFGMGDYVCDITLHTENKRDQSSRVVWANGWNITLAWYFLVFLWPQFLLKPQAKLHNQSLWCLIQRMSVPGYCIPSGIQLQKLSVFQHFYPKTHILGAWTGIFKPNTQNNDTRILSKLLHRF